MGQQVDQQVFGRAERAAFKAQLRRSREACSRMLADGRFEAGEPRVGIEIEFDLVDPSARPAMRNVEVLQSIGDAGFQNELGTYTIEVNIPPHPVEGYGLHDLEDDVRKHIRVGESASRAEGARLMTVGILPTLERGDISTDVLSPNPRYHLLDEQIFHYRGEDIVLDIEGAERLVTTSDSVAPESACTATQIHLQVSPEEFPAHWNAAQAIAGPQAALCANSPFLFGRELWRETRIPLFEQAIDHRTVELIAQGVRPRVWFGDHWISSVEELFDENARYFVPLLPVVDHEDPLAVLDAGGTPRLPEMRLHNGTVYRWNRPVYDVVAERPHLRLENRIPPSGPTVVDTLANAAFWLGVVRWLADQEPPIQGRLPYSAAAENFFAGARLGLDATFCWPGLGVIGARDLLVQHLIPGAAEGLSRLGVAGDIADRLLGIVQERTERGRNGAAWQVAAFRRRYDRSGADRWTALRGMTLAYLERMQSGEAVHTWTLD